MLNFNRLIGIAHELRDRAKRAEAPLRCRVRELVGDQIEGARHFLPVTVI
jgi:hypothetical protein